MGDVAMGEKKGSTIGFIVAVCSAVRTRRGPAGFGMTITSGRRLVVPRFGPSTDNKIPFTGLKGARLGQRTMTAAFLGDGGVDECPMQRRSWGQDGGL